MHLLKAKRKIHKSNILWSITALLLLLSALSLALYISPEKLRSFFPIRHVVFSGHKHLTDAELRTLAAIPAKESLLTLSEKGLSQRLLKSPWVRSIHIRREFPGTLSVMIEESVPFALLDMNGHLFLIDEKGKLLEELKEGSIPFLPVIIGDPFKKREVFSEALNLVRSMKDTGFLSERGHIEVVATRPHELLSVIDGTVIKIGSGEYREKLQRLVEIEVEIKKRNIPVDYVDLRFANRIILKPIKEVIY